MERGQGQDRTGTSARGHRSHRGSSLGLLFSLGSFLFLGIFPFLGSLLHLGSFLSLGSFPWILSFFGIPPFLGIPFIQPQALPENGAGIILAIPEGKRNLIYPWREFQPFLGGSSSTRNWETGNNHSKSGKKPPGIPFIRPQVLPKNGAGINSAKFSTFGGTEFGQISQNPSAPSPGI